jgi:AAA+ ATPase superfamily predicted ATPase
MPDSPKKTSFFSGESGMSDRGIIMKDIPEFVNREKDKEKVKRLLSGRPNLVYFVYGPINSGKTTLLMKVFEELPENYCVFYINFRWRDVQRVEDLIRVLFRVKREIISEQMQDFLKELFKGGARVLSRLKGIPIPENIFDVLFRRAEKVEDVFAYLEEYFENIKALGYSPVLVLDEMQTIKDVINTSGKSVLAGLFNFLVGMTKERHLCHCLCATSDCLFIEDVYSNARLEGRAEYILVDDLGKEESLKVYEEFGFEEKTKVWEYIGGKLGDMVRFYEKKKQGYSEKDALESMFRDARNTIEWMMDLSGEGEKEGLQVREIKIFLEKFKVDEERKYKDVKGKVLKFLIDKNILFFNSVEGIVRPQSRLLWKAIKNVEC